MDNVIFRKLQNAILHPSRTKEWFGMAEQVINTVYALGEHPDVFCNDVIKKLTIRAFSRPQKEKDASEKPTEKDPDVMNEDHPGDMTMGSADISMQEATQATQDDQEKDLGEAFELSQLLFVVGHVAIKHVVFLELVEREWKRQKDEKQAGTCDIPFGWWYGLPTFDLQPRNLPMETKERTKMAKSWTRLLEMLKTKLASAYMPSEKPNFCTGRSLSWPCTALRSCIYAVVPTSSRFVIS